MGDGANLTFGLKRGVPKGCRAAWGARWIVEQGGYVDQVWDRTDAFGERADKDVLFAWLNGTVGGKPAGEAARLLKSGEMSTRGSEVFSLYKDERGEVVASCNGSAGYCYVTAFMFEHVGPVEVEEARDPRDADEVFVGLGEIDGGEAAGPAMGCEGCGESFGDGIDAGTHEVDTGHRVTWTA